MKTGFGAWLRGLSLAALLLLVVAGGSGSAVAAGGSGPGSGGRAKAAPVFTSAPLTKVVVSHPYVYHVTTADADAGDTRTVTAVLAPRWLRLRRAGNGSAVLQGRAGGGQVGTHTVRLEVRDAAGATAVQEFAVVVVQPPVAAPTISPAAGSDLVAPLSVTLSTATPGATIRYTTDGTVPTADTGMLYAGPLRVSGDTSLTAVAFLPGHANSAPSLASYAFLVLAVVETGGLTAAGDGEAVLSGTVNPLGLATTAWFEWSADPSFGGGRADRSR
jgi:hypothetical protein